MKILVTGATGFIGRALVARLAEDPMYDVTAAIRRHAHFPVGVETVEVGNIDGHTKWSKALAGVDVIVHAAARVHLMSDSSRDPVTEYRRVNALGTGNLARQAATAGVQRFVFLSTIKVNGESTTAISPFIPESYDPSGAYASSKFEAELLLSEVATEAGLEVVVVRPPLVYGPGVGGNFLRMMRWLKLGIPLPLGAVSNARSLVFIENLIDFICVCITHSKANNQTFLVSDDHDVSTTHLLTILRQHLNSRSCLVPVPSRWLLGAAERLGRGDVAERLLGCLQADISKSRNLLGWSAPHSVDYGLGVTAEHFLAEHSQ